MNEEKHVLAKLENIYFGKKENEKLTMHEIGVVLDYVALLEQKSKQLQQKENIIKEVREYIKSNEKEYGSLEDNEKIILGILGKEVN